MVGQTGVVIGGVVAFVVGVAYTSLMAWADTHEPRTVDVQTSTLPFHIVSPDTSVFASVRVTAVPSVPDDDAASWVVENDGDRSVVLGTRTAWVTRCSVTRDGVIVEVTDGADASSIKRSRDGDTGDTRFTIQYDDIVSVTRDDVRNGSMFEWLQAFGQPGLIIETATVTYTFAFHVTDTGWQSAYAFETAWLDETERYIRDHIS